MCIRDRNNSLWSQVLYGITEGDGEIVTVALSQVGNVGGEPYWSWYGFGSRVEWCACFVSWCANECGYIEAGVIPVSYTHLDVYKRQIWGLPVPANRKNRNGEGGLNDGKTG